jgi:GNAT superfamily N-acetyltransferase
MKKELFFSPKFKAEFQWKSSHHLRVGSVLPHNKKLISEGLRDMSPASIRNRFLGSKRAFTETELQYLTVLDGYNHYAIGVQELSASKKGVAVVRLVRASHNESEAELAITIIDDYQNLGLGTLLLKLAILAAYEREIKTLSFTFLPQNEAIVKLIKKMGDPILGPHHYDYTQLFLEIEKLDLEGIRRDLERTLPSLKEFPL